MSLVTEDHKASRCRGVKARRAQNAAEAARPYAEKMER